jgi:antitoxin component YwqK of YwqJK toxin-antitoxin module
MLARRRYLAASTAIALSATTLSLAGCDFSEVETTAVEVKAANADENSPALAQAGDGSEPYQYIPKKKPSGDPAITEVKPIVVPNQGDQKYTYPPQGKTPEVSADITVYSDKSFEFNGKFEEFRSDGKTPHAVGTFKNDHRDGKWTYYHPNGKVAKEVIYVDGKLNGSWTHFGEDGSKNLDATYKDGKRDGVWTNYAPPDKDGKQVVAQTTQYVDGLNDGPQVQYYPNGQKRLERFYKANRQVGKQTIWYEKGGKYSEANYENGLPHGMATMWDESGKVLTQREFRNGKLVRNQDDDKKTTPVKPAAGTPDAVNPVPAPQAK